jgi:6-phosphogluconate dehydrogenase
MRFGVVGLGRMWANIARHATEKGHAVVGFDAREEVRRAVAIEGVDPASSIAELVEKLSPPRSVLVYVPHGPVTEAVCEELRPLLDPGDIIVDGGNSHWADSQRRHDSCAAVGVHFLDVGTSGGVEGARRGACFMAGGEREAYELVAPLLRDLAVDAEGAVYAGRSAPGISRSWSITRSSSAWSRRLARESSCCNDQSSSSTSPPCSATGTTAR